MSLFDLFQLELIVKGHVVNAYLISVLDVRRLLAGIGEYDAVRRDAQVENFLYFVFASTIEASAKKRQQLQEHGVRVTFYGVVGFDAWQSSYPVYVLVADVFEVNNVEWVIFDILL
jgi:hypothetical protein